MRISKSSMNLKTVNKKFKGYRPGAPTPFESSWNDSVKDGSSRAGTCAERFECLAHMGMTSSKYINSNNYDSELGLRRGRLQRRRGSLLSSLSNFSF